MDNNAHAEKESKRTPDLAELFRGLDILQRICDADLDDARYASCYESLALVLRLEMRRRSHAFLYSIPHTLFLLVNYDK